VELVKDTFKHARVLYAQTDSVFIQFCGSTIKEAIELGKEAANVTSTAFPFPMSLKLEKVPLGTKCKRVNWTNRHPFFLLNVYRQCHTANYEALFFCPDFVPFPTTPGSMASVI
jgi:hypothetical protein